MQVMKKIPDLSKNPPYPRKHIDVHALVQTRIAMEAARAPLRILCHRS